MTLLKRRRKVLYFILLFVLSFLILFAVSLGWFQTVKNNEIGGMTFYYSGVAFTLSKSADSDHNGVPDVDGSSNVVYTAISSENVEIRGLFPMASIAFKMDVSAGTRGGYFNVVFMGFSAPDVLTPTVDLADVLRIKYIDPITLQLVDKPFKEMMNSSRDVTLYSGYHITGNGDFTFKYTIYMDSQAGNEYKNKSIIIDKVVFNVTQES